MASNIPNQVSFLRTTRNFPLDAQMLTVEVNKSYVDIANAVNSRIIGLYATNNPVITGETYFISENKKQQTLRQVFIFSATSDISHNIKVTDPLQFTNCYGTYTDGTNSFGLIWGSSSATSIPGQISFYMTPTKIKFVVNGSAPSLSSGRIVLSWLANP